MADSSEVKNVDPAVSSNSGGDSVKDDESKPRIMKRSRAGVISSSTDNAEENEPDEKRPAFRLQPPTLIHGQAKSVPKPEESSNASSSSKCKFLQPSKLSGFTASTNNVTSVTKQDQQEANPEPLVSSSNPFLLMAGKDPNQENEAQTNENNENNEETSPVVNGTGSDPGESKPDSTTEEEKKEERNDENLFAQAAGNPAQSERGMGGFVFGSKMEDRVMMKKYELPVNPRKKFQPANLMINSSEQQPPEKDDGDNASKSGSGFVFGQNLSERAKVSSSTDTNPSFLPASSEGPESVDGAPSNSSSSVDASPPSPPSSSSDKKQSIGLKEDAEAHFLASQLRPQMPEIEVRTGEEDEKSVLQIQCKLHQFDATNQNWLERGLGSLHLNDGKYSDDNLHFQSRLVMRVHGSLRLVLNTKIWPSMTVEKASKKSVRVSAQTDDGSIGVFLITATMNDSEQMFRALEYRVLHQKQLEEKRQELGNEKATDDEAEPGSNSEVEPNHKDEQENVNGGEKENSSTTSGNKSDGSEADEVDSSVSPKNANLIEEEKTEDLAPDDSAPKTTDDPI